MRGRRARRTGRFGNITFSSQDVLYNKAESRSLSDFAGRGENSAV